MWKIFLWVERGTETDFLSSYHEVMHLPKQPWNFGDMWQNLRHVTSRFWSCNKQTRVAFTSVVESDALYFWEDLVSITVFWGLDLASFNHFILIWTIWNENMITSNSFRYFLIVIDKMIILSYSDNHNHGLVISLEFVPVLIVTKHSRPLSSLYRQHLTVAEQSNLKTKFALPLKQLCCFNGLLKARSTEKNIYPRGLRPWSMKGFLR